MKRDEKANRVIKGNKLTETITKVTEYETSEEVNVRIMELQADVDHLQGLVDEKKTTIAELKKVKDNITKTEG